MSDGFNEKTTSSPQIYSPPEQSSPFSTPPKSPTKQTPRSSLESAPQEAKLPPFSLPPPTEAIPLGLGPDGKSLLPKLDKDGQPLKSPPLDKDGKPLSPPPIIGPNGKEIPRPKDENGRPLPIYVSPEGYPVLDIDGNPIALRFNKEGKPIPLQVEFPLTSPSKAAELTPKEETINAASVQKDKIPKCVIYAGIFDIVASCVVTGVVLYFMVTVYQKDTKNTEWKFLAGSASTSGVGAVCGVLPIIAAKKNKFCLLWIWCAVAASLLIVEIGLIYFAPVKREGSIIPTALCGVRLIHTLCTNCFFASSNDGQAGQEQKSNQQQQQYNLTAAQGLYPSQGLDYYHYNKEQQENRQRQLAMNTMPTQSTMIIQQQTPSTMMMYQPVVVQPMMSYAYSYPSMGYGFGGGWGGGYYGGYFGGGLGCHHGYCPYYDFGWGF